MINFIKKLFTRQTVQVGDILVRDANNPFQQTKVEILGVKDGYILWKFIMIDGADSNSGIEHSSKTGDMLWLYTKQP